MTFNNALQNRVEKVERELRYWRIGGSLTALGLALSVTMAANANPETPALLQAREFQLVGDDGEVRASLKTLGRSNTQLRLYDGSGESEVTMIANDERAIVHLKNGGRLNTEDDGGVNSASIEAYSFGGSVGLSRQTGDGKAAAHIVGGSRGSYVSLRPLKGDVSRLPAE